MKLTNPSYISEQMFDKTVREKFQENLDDNAVREQAFELIRLFRNSRSRERIVLDIMHAAKVSGHSSKEELAEVGFYMGLQFGFELAISYPPLPAE
jgi:hypothetical protein